MSSRNQKRDGFIRDAKLAAEGLGRPFVDPLTLFGRASDDDLSSLPADMLALAAAHAQSELSAWDRNTARVTLRPLEGLSEDEKPVSVLSITDRNQPFLYDSVMGEVTSSHRDFALVVHPILIAHQDKTFELYTADKHDDPDMRVSHIQIIMPPQGEADTADLIERIRKVLKQVHHAVNDWRSMLTALDTAVSELDNYGPDRGSTDKTEALAFLNWLRDDNFTFLGMRDYTYVHKHGEPHVERESGSGLGILADPEVRVLRQGKDHVTTTPEILAFLEGPDHLIVTKANVRSLVHRRAYMDYIGVKRYDPDGNVAGELRIVGLFTSTAYTRSVTRIPLLRSKADTVVRLFGFDPHSHSGKLLLNTLESYPRDELFQIRPDLLARFCEQINELVDRPRVRILPRVDQFDRFVSVIVFVPRDQYDSDVRERIGNYLASTFDGHVSAFYPAFPEGALVRVHFIIGRAGGKTPQAAADVLERDVRTIVTRWEDRFASIAPPDTPKFDVTDAYREHYSPEDAVADLPDILGCSPEDSIRIAFYRRPDDPMNRLELKIFHSETPVELSRRVPLLENLGFEVISERTFEICLTDTKATRLVVLHDMELAHADGADIDLAARRDDIEEAWLSVWHGLSDNDRLNQLVVDTDLDAREVSVLRAYARYLRQAGITYSQGYIAGTLNRYAEIAADLFALFRSRFDPALSDGDRETAQEEIVARIEEALTEVPNLDDDRILRRYVNLITSSLRTNYFRTGDDGAPLPTLAFKLDPRAIEGLPQPRPYREIFTYGPEVEGVHLRFGPVARGGLRWSDRAQDYRTEVLGLVKAQQVKNAVIVPVGAKGGFYPRRLPAGGSRDVIFEAGREAYKTFIRTLLSVTDNIVGDGVVPPPNTVRHDGDDPYFVVAADKGTATFSDTANAISQNRDFWLDDAFASGGSAGYDHKKMGITAKGAWEAVKRHFREMNHDIQSQPFTAVGVGDMSGDVFGNGMLLSTTTRLIAAFDHRDIFIDPDPDAATSFEERQRMFELPRSSWQDYDKSLLSPGGMIVSRSAKSITLTPEAAAAIGMEKLVASPFEIMRAILAAPADLLWFGGIGTYVRGNEESDTEVGDRGNDAIRISASEVGAKVIGEGANLGVTQRGRIDFCLNGGRCNSDAIDNSAGVNCSDVEVNIKIALASAMRDGRLTRSRRDTLLAAMTEEVSRLVLRNNYLQTLAISLTERRGLKAGDELASFMSTLEAAGKLDRKVELLPDDHKLAERYSAGKPLTRPEIGVLLSYAKIVLFDELTAGHVPDDPYFAPTLVEYFPDRMQDDYAADIASHRLRREIISTVVANDIVNRTGPGFITWMAATTGAPSTDIVRAYVLVRDGLGLAALANRIDALDTLVDGDVQNAMYAEIAEIARAATAWALKTDAFEEGLSNAIERLSSAMRALEPALADLLPDFLVEAATEHKTELTEAGVPEDVAQAIANLRFAAYVPEIMQISDETGATLDRAAAAYFAVTEALRIGRITTAAERVATADRYEALALSRGLEEISAARRAITIAALSREAEEDDPVGAWLADGGTRIDRLREQVRALTEGGEITVSRMTVAAGLMNDLARAGQS